MRNESRYGAWGLRRFDGVIWQGCQSRPLSEQQQSGMCQVRCLQLRTIRSNHPNPSVHTQNRMPSNLEAEACWNDLDILPKPRTRHRNPHTLTKIRCSVQTKFAEQNGIFQSPSNLLRAITRDQPPLSSSKERFLRCNSCMPYMSHVPVSAHRTQNNPISSHSKRQTPRCMGLHVRLHVSICTRRPWLLVLDSYPWHLSPSRPVLSSGRRRRASGSRSKPSTQKTGHRRLE